VELSNIANYTTSLRFRPATGCPVKLQSRIDRFAFKREHSKNALMNSTPPRVCALAKCAPKNRKPPICIGGSERPCAIDRPRYMNVPSPAPCHVSVAGVAKQSVWGLRIIARSQLSLWHESPNSSIDESGCYLACFPKVENGSSAAFDH
jgi:hypothetical protein